MDETGYRLREHEERHTMKTSLWPLLVVSVSVCTATPAGAQTPVGALAIDERQGDQWGWAVDYETAAAAQGRALQECGSGCSVVLTFGRCAAYAADQDADSTAVGWAESFDAAAGARQAALAECRSRGGGSGCVVRAWGCNGPVVEEGLDLDRAARRRIQQGLQAAGFDPGGADGLFGPRTRAAIRNWQTARGARPTGYLDGPSAAALRSADGSGPVAAAAAPPVAKPPSTASTAAPASVATAAQENLFWQSIVNSTNPADFEAYLAQFPNGVFRPLARNRLTALRQPSGAPAAAGTRVGGAGSPISSARVSGAGAATGATASAGDARRRPGEVFRDCAECPEMVVMPGGRLAMGRYEVTVEEYRAFAAETSGGAGGCRTSGNDGSWRNPGFPQTDRHPVTCVNWDDTHAYVSWLSRTTGSTYRLPTETEWDRAAAGSQPGCYEDRTGNYGTCPVGSYGSNPAGLSDMVGNVWEWTEDCWEGDCGRRVLRGGSSAFNLAEFLGTGWRDWFRAGSRISGSGFRVASPLD